MSAPFKKLIQQAPRALRTAKPLPPRRLVRRPFTSTEPLQDSEMPSFSQTDETIIEDYPEDAQEAAGIGHTTVGPGVGRHNSRTLSTFSMSGKVRLSSFSSSPDTLLSYRAKVCVVTGAARGLGNLFARTFVESGSDRIVIMDRDGDMAVEAAKDIEQWFVQHGQAKKGEIEAVGMGVNVADENSVRTAFDDVVKRYGRIDVLVTAAGIGASSPISSGLGADLAQCTSALISVSF